MKKCPYCAEEIQEEAIKCKHCAKMLSIKTKPENHQATKDIQKKKLERTLASKVGNVFGILLVLTGVYGLIVPGENSRLFGFGVVIFGITITDYYLPLIRGHFSQKNIERIRVFLPFIYIAICLAV